MKFKMTSLLLTLTATLFAAPVALDSLVIPASVIGEEWKLESSRKKENPQNPGEILPTALGKMYGVTQRLTLEYSNPQSPMSSIEVKVFVFQNDSLCNTYASQKFEGSQMSGTPEKVDTVGDFTWNSNSSSYKRRYSRVGNVYVESKGMTLGEGHISIADAIVNQVKQPEKKKRRSKRK